MFPPKRTQPQPCTHNAWVRNSSEGVDLPQEDAKGPHVRLVGEFLQWNDNTEMRTLVRTQTRTDRTDQSLLASFRVQDKEDKVQNMKDREEVKGQREAEKAREKNNSKINR